MKSILERWSWREGGEKKNIGVEVFSLFLFWGGGIDVEGRFGMDLAPQSWPFQSSPVAQVMGHRSSPPPARAYPALAVGRRKERVGSGGGVPRPPTPLETAWRGGRMSARAARASPSCPAAPPAGEGGPPRPGEAPRGSSAARPSPSASRRPGAASSGRAGAAPHCA